MEDTNSNKPFVCGRCNKSFEKESTYKRHGYYCLSRQASQRVSRKRSCAACTKAKVRCDSKLPQCSTCETKRISCHYSEGALKRYKANSPTPGSAVNIDAGPNSDLTSLSISTLPTTSDSLSEPCLADSPALHEVCELLWPGEVMNGLLELEAAPSPFDWGFERDLGYRKSPEGSFHSPHEMNRQSMLGSLQGNSSFIPASLSISSRSLEPRALPKASAKTSALFLTRILGSYPAMMTRKQTFPPFIHPHTESGNGNSLPEALANCMSIAQLFVNRNKETTKFVWRTIKMEQERLWLEHECFSDWELLASMQALIIYTIMRMAEGPTEHNDFDMALLTTFNMVCSTLADRVGSEEFEGASGGDNQHWKDWIFHESRRRFVTIARILNIFTNIDCAVRSPALAGFAIFPLPAKKVLWKASHPAAWGVEFAEGLRQRELYGLATDGRLVKLRCDLGAMNETATDWEAWYAGMDEFGTLIMITASLL